MKLLLVLATIFLTACGEAYMGPLADKPVDQINLGNGQTRVLTLLHRVLEQSVPEVAVHQAFDYFDQNRNFIHNRNWLSIVDFTQYSGQRRLFVIDLNGGTVETHFVTHGEGSDPEDTGFAQIFSNQPESLMSSLGFYLVAEPYNGKWGYSARLDGLQESNSNVRERAIVMHGADYVDPSREKMGRSQGCLAVELSQIETLVRKLNGDSLLYAYIEGMTPSRDSDLVR